MRSKTLFKLLRTPSEIILSLHIFILVISIPILLKLFRLNRIVSILTPPNIPCIYKRIETNRILYLCSRIQNILARVGIRYNCLRRSLLLYNILRLLGIEVIINFGAKWDNEKLVGHSWLSLNNDPYLEPKGKDLKFTYFFSLPSKNDPKLEVENFFNSSKIFFHSRM